MNRKKITKIVIALLVILSIPVTHYFLNRGKVDKEENEIKRYNTLLDIEQGDVEGEPHNLDGTNFTGEVLTLNNRLEFINKAKVFDNAISVCNGLMESTMYINFILEDFKSNELKEYFDANTTVLVKLYGINEFEEFEVYYNKIKNLGKLKSYEIDIDSVVENGSVFNFDLILKGDVDVKLPVTAATLNNEDLIATIIMNK